jgi:hypothetical protein
MITISDRLANCDPDEAVSAPILSAGRLFLKTAVARILTLPAAQQQLAEIFRDFMPTTLRWLDIEELSNLPRFRTETATKTSM